MGARALESFQLFFALSLSAFNLHSVLKKKFDDESHLIEEAATRPEAAASLCHLSNARERDDQVSSVMNFSSVKPCAVVTCAFAAPVRFSAQFK